jgi:hypothetical protein
MAKKLITCLLVCSQLMLQGQIKMDSATSKVSLMISWDLAFNFHDKVLNAGVGRKLTVGASFTNENRAFIGFAGIGIKWYKANVFSPAFRQSFIKDVQANYVPIQGGGEDSLIGAKMNGSPKGDLWGTYAGFFQLGFLLNKSKFKPTVVLYMGMEDFLLHDRKFTTYINPEDESKNIDYVGMWTTFYEFKIGGTVPIKKIADYDFCPLITVGYKWVDYDDFIFNSTPLSAYTNNSLNKKYGVNGKFTISFFFLLWSNWGPQ